MRALTLTTIHIPRVIETYARNFRDHGHDDCIIVVVGDLKSPPETGAYCAQVARDLGCRVEYFDVERQRDYLRRSPALAEHLPYNTFSRRNIGDLYAYEEGASVIVRTDDDNYPLAGTDYLGGHAHVGVPTRLPTVSSRIGWYNCCELLEAAHGRPFYPRGFPYPLRWKDAGLERREEQVRVGLNAGLWLGEPDVDAITRLAEPIDALRLRADAPSVVALARGTWCAVNTQNTAYARELIPAAFVSPFLGRYDDIWSGYLLRKLMDHLDDRVSYGLPLVRQDRNVHDLWKDLEHEMKGNILTPHLLDVLGRKELKGTSYAACYAELADHLEREIQEDRDYFAPVWTGMRIWAEIFLKQ
jgi:hypothetical protein